MGKGYFQGWYFKMQNKDQTVACIPAKHTDETGTTSASLQIMTQSQAYTVPFPGQWYIEHQKPFFIRLGDNFFSESGIELNLDAPELQAKGRITFRNITPIAYDIMGPFRYMPFMECRHSVFSMTHQVDGLLTINGKIYIFQNGVGYIEGDRGRSFPKEYIWTQCNFQQKGSQTTIPTEAASPAASAGKSTAAPASVMLSVADIPLAGLHFTGVIAAVYWKGQEYRLATYLGAKATEIAKGAVTVRQGPYTLTARLLEDSSNAQNAHLLQAPVAGSMQRTVREHPACKAQYRFYKKGEPLFDLSTDRASFEYEYPN